MEVLKSFIEIGFVIKNIPVGYGFADSRRIVPFRSCTDDDFKYIT